MTKALALLAILSVAAHAKEDVPEKEPGTLPKGKLCQWKAKDGLVYRYYIPKKFDPEKGANLTLILHGSNLNAGWGFWNHKAGEFRPDDIVVSPDGTTPNGRGGFNFLGEPKDAERLNQLHGELKKFFRIRATYLYGHSQGSFFAFFYAGLYPEDVQGVVGHASGVWNWTKLGKHGHGQAIVLMHGTQDPVVPYGQSVGGYEAFRAAKYAIVRLRSLEGWNHWPAEHNGPVHHTSQQLAWVEGMTTADPQRLETCFEYLADCKNKERTDYNAVYTLAKRALELPFATGPVRRRAQKAIESVDKLVADHIKALKPGKSLDGKPWVMHLPVFLRTFMDVPACEAFAKDWKKTLDTHEKKALAQLKKYWNAKHPGDGFEAGVAAIKAGYLCFRCHDSEFLKKLAQWRAEAKRHKIGKKALKDYDELVPKLQKSIESGYKAFFGINRKAGKF